MTTAPWVSARPPSTAPAASPASVTATVVQLKLRLMLNAWRGDTWRRVGAIIAYVVAAGVALTLVLVAIGLRTADTDTALAAVTLVGFGGTLAWTITPLLTFGLDETVDPARFCLLPVRASALLPGVLAAGVLGAPGLATLIGALATTVTWTRGPGVLAAPVLALIGVATCVSLSRVVTTSAARVLSGRRGRETATAALALVLALGGLVPPLIDAIDANSDGVDVDLLTQLAGWTPFGAPWAAAGDLVGGHVLRGTARAGLAVAVLAALLWWWGRTLQRTLETPSTSATRRTRQKAVTLLDRLPATPTWAIAGRTLLAVRRDSRYLVSLLSPLIIVAVISGGSRGSTASIAFGAVFGAFAIGSTAANSIGFDGSAFGAHLFTGVPGKADRWGRALAMAAVGTPMIVLAVTGGAIFGGRLDRLPLLASLGVGVLLVTLGSGSLLSVVAPYPVPEAGTNPFVSRSSGGLRPFVGQLVMMSVLGAVALPALILGLAVDATWAHVLAVLISPVLGVGLLALGVSVSARIYEQQGPEILAAVRRDG